MPRNPKVKVTLDADDKASAKVSAAQGKFKGFGAFLRSGAFLGAFAVVTVAIGKMISAISAAIDLFVIQDRAATKLRGSLGPLGDQAERVAQALERQASAIQANSTFGDEAIIAAQSLIASFTREEEQIKALTQATVDFAAATGSDLNSAASLVARSFASSTNALTRYGIEVEGTAGSTERLNSLVENSSALFGGQAKAAVDAYSGAITQLANSEGDLAEAIGATFVASEDLIDEIQKQEQATRFLTETVNQNGGAFSGLLEFWARAKTAALNLTTVAIGAANSLRDQAGAAQEAGDQTERLAKAEEDKAAASQVLVDIATALVQVTNELTAAEKRRDDALLAGGVQTNSQIATQLEELRVSQLEYDALLREGEIDRTRYAEGTARIADEIAALEAVQSGAVATVELYEASLGQGAEGLDRFGASSQAAAGRTRDLTASLRGARAEAEATTQAVRLTAAAFDDLSRAEGRRAAVQAALAAGGRLTQGGRRVQLPGGGSRLVEEAGFGGSGGPSGGVFTTIVER